MSEPAPLPQPRMTHAASWVLYDLANTIYSATVTYLFVRYLTTASLFGLVTTLSMLLAGVGTPLFASLADRTGRAGAYLTVTTLVCVAAMTYFGVGRCDADLLVAYFVANVCYQAALVFYNSLLPSVATEKSMGLVSGLGVGLGYLGVVFTLVIMLPVKQAWGWRPAFIAGGIGFLVTALPCLVLVRDRRPIARERVTREVLATQFSEVLATLKRLPEQPALMWFLLTNFFAVDVLNTAIHFYGRVLEKGFEEMMNRSGLRLLGYTVGSMDSFVMIAGLGVVVPAFLFGIALGYWTDRVGSFRAFAVSVLSLAAGLLGAGLFIGWSPFGFILAMSTFGGLGLAGVWTAGRKLLVELTPRDLVGRYFGIYGITNKVSVIGSSICGIVMDALGARAVVFTQVAALVLAIVCLARLRGALAARYGKP